MIVQRSSYRQHLRQRQAGRLQRSTLYLLAGVACAGLLLSQIPRAHRWIMHTEKGFVQWTADHGLTIERVDVEGRKRVAAQDILNALKITRGSPLLLYHPNDAQERLAQNPWFKDVYVERRLPQTIFVRVVERQPAARWQVDGKLALVDTEGVVLTTQNMDLYTYLPIIIGQEARHKVIDLFALLRAVPDLVPHIQAATWVGNRRWNLSLKNNIVIKLPEEQPGLALENVQKLMDQQNLLERDITTVDLRLPGKAILQPTTRANVLIERPDFSDTPDPSKKSI